MVGYVMDYEAEEIDRLDLAKYGLSRLAGKNMVTLDRADLDALLLALGNDEISLNLPVPCTAENVREVLARAECRRCGRCCLPNPANPASPGVEVFDEELNAIAGHLQVPVETLRRNTIAGKTVPYAFQPTRLGFTRWLPLPCPFYGTSPGGCQVYPARAVVCQVYPIVFTGDDTYMSIRVTCDYGKDVFIGALDHLRNSDPGLEITL
jgi:Fe-S-cluster containining protein